MEKATLVIMCGVPGVGKDYAIHNEAFFEGFRENEVSRDKIRFGLLKEGEDYFSKEKEVFDEFVRQLSDGLKQGRTMIANATHITRASRKKLIRAIDDTGVQDYQIMIYCVNADTDVILRQNSQRTGLACVPQEVILKMVNTYQTPMYREDARIKLITIKY